MFLIKITKSGRAKVHEAKADRPRCGGAHGKDVRAWQQDMYGPVTCKRCLRILAKATEVKP